MKKILSLILIASILVPLLVAIPAMARDETPRANPGLLEMAKQSPNALFRVIVQRDTKQKNLPDDEPEAFVAKNGGQVKKQLRMIDSFAAELTGKEIENLAKHKKVRWISLDAPMFSSDVVQLTVADVFSAVSFSGNSGRQDWRGPWQELAENDGPAAGIVQVGASSCITGYCLLITPASPISIEGFGAQRQADLSHATSAYFSYSYRRATSGGSTGSVKAQVSADGGATWVTLTTHALNSGDSNNIGLSFDISGFISARTQVRFIGSGTASRAITFDNVQIKYSITTNLDAPFGHFTARDDFASASYSGSDGTRNWSTNWIEQDAAGISATSGNIKAYSSTACSGGTGYCLYVSNNNVGDTVYRTINLTGATSAGLQLWRNNLLAGLNNNDSITLEASSNGIDWTVLRIWRDTLQDIGSANESFDLTPYISAATSIRFKVATRSDSGSILFDNIQIQYSISQNNYIQSINANRVWSDAPYLDGQGVTVAVVDSGFGNKADFQVYGGGSSRILAAVDFGSIIPDSSSDGYGHGTHVAGIIASNGAATGGTRSGVAPGVNLVNVKVSDANGLSLGSDLIEGLQWIYDNRAAYNIKIVNISMNSSVPESYLTSPIDAAVEILWFNGITVVVSAGNNGNGSTPVTLLPPANDPFVITVGSADENGNAVINDDQVSAFSAFGTTDEGFSKPDLVAPGRDIISLLSSTDASIYINHPANRVNSTLFRMSGTSMAAPMVSGAAALLLQDEPTLTPDQVKYRLLATANKSFAGYSQAKAGAGYLDVYAAVHGLTTQSANTGQTISNLVTSGSTAVYDSVAWNSVAWNSVAWNSVAWNSVAWNSVAWNSVAWNSVAWNSDYWGQ